MAEAKRVYSFWGGPWDGAELLFPKSIRPPISLQVQKVAKAISARFMVLVPAESFVYFDEVVACPEASAHYSLSGSEGPHDEILLYGYDGADESTV